MTSPSNTPLSTNQRASDDREYECHSLPRVGDDGQRYVVSIFDEERGTRMDVAYTDDPRRAAELATCSELRSSWHSGWVTDRKPQA